MASTLAQTFMFSNRPNGAYATRIDLFFATKDPIFGVTVQLRECINGQPTQKILPFSSVSLQSSEVYIDETQPIATSFWFESPVYLKPDTEYAIAILPGGDSPNYQIWTGRLGDTLVGTDDIISKQPDSGVLFLTQNGRTWTEFQEYDLRYNLKCAEFDATGNIIFINENADFLNVANTTGQFAIGELVYGNTSSNVVSSNTNFSSDSGFGIFKYYQEGDQSKVVLSPMITKLSAGQTIRGVDSGTTAVITSIDDIVIDSSFIKAEFLEPEGSDSTYQIRGYSDTGVSDVAYHSFQINETINNVSPKKIYSFSNEQDLFSGSKTNTIKINLATVDPSVSPAFDDDRFSSYQISNLINNDASGEQSINGGNALSRYITRSVTLEDGQDAEDLNVYLDAYKPRGTNINVYYKILNSSDTEVFAQKEWKLMEQETDSSLFSTPQNFNDLKEYKYVIPTADKTFQFGEVKYTNSSGGTFVGFITFAVKIVNLSSTTSEIPRVKNLRVIALQV
jgi:hypothetical protein